MLLAPFTPFAEMIAGGGRHRFLSRMCLLPPVFGHTGMMDSVDQSVSGATTFGYIYC